MSTPLRMKRALSAATAAGLLVLGAVGCGAINETKEAPASETPSTETSSAAPEPKESEFPGPTESPTSQGGTDPNPASPSDGGGSTPGSGTGGIGSGGLPAGMGEPVEVDPTPLTDQEKEQSKQMMADLLVAITTSGDFSALCDITVFKEPDGSMHRMDTTPEMREQCVQAMGSFSGQGQGGGAGSGMTEEQAKSTFDPATFELKDNGDGTFALAMAGQPLGFNVLKIKDGGVRLVVAQ